MSNYGLADFVWRESNPHPRVGTAIGYDRWQDYAPDTFLGRDNAFLSGDSAFLMGDDVLDTLLFEADRDLAAMELELDALESANTKSDIGRSLFGFEKAQQNLDRTEDKVSWRAENARNPAVRRAAQNRLRQIEMRKKILEAKKDRKASVMADKLGVPRNALGMLSPGDLRGRERLAQQSAAYAEAGQAGRIERTAFSGTELRIPFELNAVPLQLITIPAGAGVRTAAINLQTSIIPYAGFVVRGLDFRLNIARGQNAAGFPNQDILPTVIITQVTVNGGLGLVYRPESIDFVGQGGGVAGGGGRRTFQGLRSNPQLEPNNTATLQATFRQEITTAVDYNATFEASIVVERLYDSHAQTDV